MEPERLVFLFGTTQPDFEIDDEGELTQFFERDSTTEHSEGRLKGAARTIVARQILSDTPPVTWTTAQRLLAAGLQPSRALDQMAMAAVLVVQRALREISSDDDEPKRKATADVVADFDETYACLPVPELPEIQRAIVEVVTAEQGIAWNELSRRVVVQLGRMDDLTSSLVEGAVEQSIMDDDVLVVLHPDRLVYPLRLFAGARLAHRVTEFEHELGRLYLGDADLVALEIGPDEEATFDTAVFNVGDLVEVGLGSNDRLETLPLPSGDIDTAIVAEIVELYHEGYDSDGLPVKLVDLFAGLCLRRPGVLLHPMAPMSELCVAAGLDVRNNHVGDGPDAWRNMRHGDRAHRAYDIFDGDHETAHRVLETIETLEAPSSSATDLRTAYGSMDDPEIGPVVLELIAGADALEDDAEFEADARAMVAHLVAVARRDDDKSWAHLLAALVEERTYNVLAAEAHIHAAYSANPEFGPIIDRMAWYASDRGDAPAAVRWWRQLDGDPGELAIVENFAKPARSAMGRNEPCWCGSGRKFKACHLNAVDKPPLPDRVGWLCRKATSYLARRGGEAATDIEELCRCRATDPDDQGSVETAMEDPIVIDCALTEMGWFETFLEARGPLLPEDEQLLAQSWLLVERTVFEIVEVHTGTGLVVRDLRTGDVLDVRERTMSRHTQVGDRWCARAVPDGESHQFIGGLFIVAPGTEIGLLELLEVGDPFALCEWVRNLHSAPRLATREGEPLVACTTTMRVGDPVAALGFLDAAYERDGETWHEMYELSEDERVVRATLVLSGDVLTVSTHSEPRLDRVLAAVRDALPDVTVLTDERLPMTADKIGEVREAMAKTVGSSPGAAPVSLSTADREEILAMMERRWLNEPVPALQGLTPVAAAADPTRRDDVVRLLRSFPTGNDDHDLLLRPERLLAELGLG